MKRRPPLPGVENETTLLRFKQTHEALAAAAAEKLRKMRAAEESLARVRALSEGACRRPSTINHKPSTASPAPYENAA